MEKRSKSLSMKVAIVLIVISAFGLISWYMFQTNGPHDGTVKKADNFFIEMRNEENHFHTWLYDANFKPINNSGITGDVLFFLSDSTTFNVTLKPFLEDEFVCESIPGFYACKITFNVVDKSPSAMFDNPTPIVEEK
jgi:hypothetical protein